MPERYQLRKWIRGHQFICIFKSFGKHIQRKGTAPSKLRGDSPVGWACITVIGARDPPLPLASSRKISPSSPWLHFPWLLAKWIDFCYCLATVPQMSLLNATAVYAQLSGPLLFQSQVRLLQEPTCSVSNKHFLILPFPKHHYVSLTYIRSLFIHSFMYSTLLHTYQVLGTVPGTQGKLLVRAQSDSLRC